VVRHLAKKLARREAAFRTDLKPIVVFLLGPSGTGKTYLGRSVAKALGAKLVEVSLNAYKEANSVASLRGTSAGYKGFGGETALSPLIAHPSAVVLLDEFEKAHPDVHEFFYNIFDSGAFTLGDLVEVQCPNATFILTSNAGGEYVPEDAICTGPRGSWDLDPRAVGILKQRLSDAFLNRIEGFYALAHFQENEIREVGEGMLRTIRQKYCASHGLLLGWTGDLVERVLLASAFQRGDGIRTLRQLFLGDRGVEDVLWARHKALAPGSLVVFVWDDDAGRLDFLVRRHTEYPVETSNPSKPSDDPVHLPSLSPPTAFPPPASDIPTADATEATAPALEPYEAPATAWEPAPMYGSETAVRVATAVALWAVGTATVYVLACALLPLAVAQALTVALSAVLAVGCLYARASLAAIALTLWELARLAASLWALIPAAWRPYVLGASLLLLCLALVTYYGRKDLPPRSPPPHSSSQFDRAANPRETRDAETQTEANTSPAPSSRSTGTQTDPGAGVDPVTDELHPHPSPP